MTTEPTAPTPDRGPPPPQGAPTQGTEPMPSPAELPPQQPAVTMPAGPPLMPETPPTASATPPTEAPSPKASPPAAAARARQARTAKSGPAPSRIVAAAASVSAGIGLVALMAGAQPDTVVEINPTPVLVQPASIVVEMPAMAPGTETDTPVTVRVVEQAVAVEQPAPAPQARPVAQSQGS
jgi:hypothetical protein